MAQYSGIKHADDTNDAFFLAELLSLKILPTGYIYDAALRPTRDLRRRRLRLVHHRAALMLSFKSLYTLAQPRASQPVNCRMSRCDPSFQFFFLSTINPQLRLRLTWTGLDVGGPCLEAFGMISENSFPLWQSRSVT